MAEETWTARTALEWTCGYLERRGDENPRLAAEWLLSEACGLTRVQLYMDYDRPLSAEEREVLRGYVTRRGQGEPLQYIAGEAPFRYLTLKVRPGVLIPRPETEVLVSEALACLPPAAPRAAAWSVEAAEQEAAAVAALKEQLAELEAAQASVGSPGREVGAGDDGGGIARGAGAGAAAPEQARDAEAALAGVGSDAGAPSSVSRETLVRDGSPFGELAPTVPSGIPADAAVAAEASVSRETAAPPYSPEEDYAADGASGVSCGDETAALLPATSRGDAAGDAEAASRDYFLVADICTGSGCVACAIASERPDTRVIAVDVAPEAVALARENAQAAGVAETVRVLQGNLGDPVPERYLGRFDLVASNPPYVPTDVLAGIPREVSDYEPALALDGGADGLDLFRPLLAWTVRALRPGGAFACELHEGHLDAAVALACAAGLEGARVVTDLAGRPRVLVARKPQ